MTRCASYALYPGVVALAIVTVFQPGFAAERDVTFHDLTAMEWMPLLPGVRSKTVVGERASFIVGEFEPGAATRPHHHTFETFVYGVEGDLTTTIGGVSRPVGPDRATVALPDVEHVTRNVGTTRGVMIELPDLKRLDLVPPRATIRFPSAPEPRPAPEGRTVAADFRDTSASMVRVGANREGSLSGDHVTLRVLTVEPGTANAVNLRPESTGAEQLAYMLRGAGELTVNGKVTAMKEGTLAILPAATSRVLFRTTSATAARIVDFHPIPGSKLPSIR